MTATYAIRQVRVIRAPEFAVSAAKRQRDRQPSSQPPTRHRSAGRRRSALGLPLIATARRKNRTNLAGKTNGWKAILNALTVHYGDRIAAYIR
ncbi:hypothetical protein [Candidatus Poriferisodalis sp.]|uniref:hypothetical protein n=1 Tax=Candidatus Poriferisodalis sp. TaxID=3101277 RepID=UPI003B02BCE5